MEPDQLRMIVARGALLIACGLAVAAWWMPWCYRDLGLVYGYGGPPLTMVVAEPVREFYMARAADVSLMAGGVSAYWAGEATSVIVFSSLYALLFSALFLIPVYSRAGMILWVVRGLSLGLLVISTWVNLFPETDRPGEGMRLLEVVAFLHAFGLCVVPRAGRMIQ